MKENSFIKEVLQLCRKYNPTPETLRYVFRQVRKRGNYVVENKSKKFPVFLTASEIYHVLSISDRQKPIYSILIRFLLYTGFRISEVVKLKVDNIDFNNNQIFIRGKGQVDRIIPLAPVLKVALIHFLNGRKDGFVFRKKNHKPYTTRNFQIQVLKIGKLCYLQKKVTPHTFRHTFATMLRSKGFKLQDIQMILGHSSIKTTEIYAHMDITSIKDDFIKLLGMGD
jgi:integrase/recombinase XerD